MTDPRSEAQTFLFSDIEGSTRRWEHHPQAMAAALIRHDALLRTAIAAAGGTVFKTVGDAFCAVFATPEAAIQAALTAQRALAAASWVEVGGLRVRMAIHTGVAEARDNDYFGPSVNRVARLLDAAHGGQVLLSGRVAAWLQMAPDAGIAVRDLGQHRLRDLIDAERLYQLLAPDLAADFPSPKTLDAQLWGLPAPVDAFIGREREVAEVTRLVDASRLVTITGPGGVGKTRLAIAVGREMRSAFTEEAVFVDLSPVLDPSSVGSAIAAGLGAQDPVDQSLVSTVAAVLRNRQLLLVLDNMEQVLAAAPVVAELLAACPGLRVLATSRVRLRLRGEREYPLAPLAVPELGRQPNPSASPAIVTQSPAGSLFVERAREARPGFALTETSAADVAVICHQVDGLPLALELAAARIRVLSPAVLRRRLEDLLLVLAAGPRDLPARQRTIRATVEWSYDLLSPDEQRLLRRLSVFRGGWTIPAAEAVASVDDPAGDALEALTGLVDASLVSERGEVAGESRYRMLETIRQFAVERLTEAENASMRGWHRDYFLAYSERAQDELSGSEQAAWLERLEADHDNVRAALDWSIQTGAVESALRQAAALWWFWWVRGYPGEGRRWLSQVLQLDYGADVALPRARVLHGAGSLAEAQGDYRQAALDYQESLALYRSAGDDAGVATVVASLGQIAQDQGDYVQATTHFEEALAICRASGDQGGEAYALINLGTVAALQGARERAQTFFQDGLDTLRVLDDQRGLAAALTNIGTMTLEQGDPEAALPFYEQALPLWSGIGDSQGRAIALTNIGEVMQHRGDWARAVAFYGEALPIYDELGDRRNAAAVRAHLGQIALEQSDLTRAGALLVHSLDVYQEIGDKEAIARSLENLGALATATGAAAEAARLFGRAEALRSEIGAPRPVVADAGYQRAIAATRSSLGDDQFAAAWATGQTSALDEILGLARRLASPVAPILCRGAGDR